MFYEYARTSREKAGLYELFVPMEHMYKIPSMRLVGLVLVYLLPSKVPPVRRYIHVWGSG